VTTAEAATTGAVPAKGLIERLLSPVADVRPGETLSVLLLSATMFLLLTGYYLLKTAREVFILSEGGAEVKSYASAGQALLLLVLVPAYGAFAARANRVQLISWVTLFFASHAVAFALLARGGLAVGIPYFLWFGIFNVMVIAQFWAFANDLYTQEQGKRLFPLIGVGSSLGAWVGSMRAGTLVDTLGPLRLLIGGAAILVLCVALARLVERCARAGPAARASAAETVGGDENGFRMILSDRYLALIALLVVLLNLVNTSGEYLFGRYVVEAAARVHGSGPEAEAARAQFIGSTYSGFFSSVNLIGLLLQLFVVSRLFRFLGVARTLFIHPLAAAGGYLLMLRAPSFDAIRMFKTVDNAIDYSLGNTTRHALWLPTSRPAKYKAKQAVDSFCVRAGDVLQAGVVFAGERAAFSIATFAGINLALTAAWLFVVTALAARLRARATAAESVL
jgi:AAA family ATP:ADP antiporter